MNKNSQVLNTSGCNTDSDNTRNHRMTTDIDVTEPNPPTARVDESATLLQVIHRAATDPNCDIDKMERLMKMYERAQSRIAEAAFNAAFSEMQIALPSISERGNAAGRYTYALWEDINEAIKPVLRRFGFSLNFRSDLSEGITVTGVLSHSAGHKIETTIKLPTDPSGNKNPVQAVASSVSYGKRYTATLLLNLTSHGEDDDAFAAAGGETISDEQEATLSDMIEATGSDKRRFLSLLRVEKLSDLPASEYNRALSLLRQKERAMQGKQK